MKRFTALGVALLLVLAACGSSSEVEIGDVWARTSASSQENGAVYMTITGADTTDRLTGVSVTSDVARMAQVHETVVNDGLMSMQEVTAIDIPADGQVALEPGSFHIMLMQLAEPLVVGSEFSVTLTFEEAGDIEVTAEVRDG